MPGSALCSAIDRFGWERAATPVPASPRSPWSIPVPTAEGSQAGMQPVWGGSPGTLSAGREMPPELAQSCKSALPFAAYTYGMRFIYEGERAYKEELRCPRGADL